MNEVSSMAPDSIVTIPGLLKWRAENFPNGNALYHKDGGWWKGLTWRDYLREVDELGRGLLALGVEAGDRVAILSTTRIEWVLADLAIMGCGAVTTPIYHSNTPEQCRYVIGHSGSKVIFVEDQEQLDKLQEVWPQTPGVYAAIVFEKFDAAGNDRVSSLDKLKALAKKIPQNGSLKKRRDRISPGDPATIVYTSGTTGPPKGVVLTHKNVLFTVKQICEILALDSRDLSVAYLPTAHIAERMVGLFMKLKCGARTAFAESMDDVGFNMKEVGPTFHFGTPRVFEKFHSKVVTAIGDATRFQQWIYRWALLEGERKVKARFASRRPSLLTRIKHGIADWLVLRKIRAILGGNLRLLISGGAPISPDILKWMQSVGLNILEVYGMTESTGLISANSHGENRLGSVGKVLPGTQMRIADDGEILARGKHVCAGYFGDEQATRDAIDSDGWLHTGDIGRIDGDGYLWITDRIKDLIITTGGKNIAPQNIENLMKTSPYISQFMIFGDRRNYLTALLTLDEDEITKFGRDKKLIYSDLQELSQLPEIGELIGNDIDRLNAKLASFETIKKFRILEDELSQDDEEVTPTLKVKRGVIEERYGHLIDEMYRE